MPMSGESATSNATILVVDDNASNRKLIEGHLEAAGYSAMTADGGAQAIELFAAAPADLILLDILMPGMDGFETCRRIRQLRRGDTTPIVFLTALDEAEAQAKAQEAGADDFLTKPVRGLELLLRVRSLLRIRQLQDEIERKNAALRVSAEARADRSEQRYRTLFAASNDAILVHEPSGRILETNVRAAEFLGRDCDELRGMFLADLHTPEAFANARAASAALESTGREVFEIEFRRKDDTTFPAEVSATRFDLDGVSAVQGIVRDITERKQAERRLAETRAREQAATDLLRLVSRAQESFISGRNPRLVFDDMLAPLLELTSSEYGFIGEVLHDDDDSPYVKIHALTNIAWNEETRRLYDQNAAEGLEFRNLKSLFGAVMTSGDAVISNDRESDPRSGGIPPGHPPLERFLGLPFFKGDVMVGMAGLANRPGGYDPDVVDYLEPFSATCAGIIEAYRSDQRREESERSLRETEEQLRQAQKLEALGALAGGVAHDFNNLLTSILSFSRFVLDDLPAGHPGREDLSEVLRAGDSAVQLTSQLLSFARRRPVEPRIVDVRETVGTAQKMLRRTVGENIEFVVLLSDEKLPVMIDPGALDQIIFNLCVNARDAMPGGGTLTLEVAARTVDSSGSLPPGDYVAFTVRDTGTGIPADVAEHIFEPFFTTKGEKGTGLGLATCHGIVKQALGDITLRTEVGEGTAFTVLLPRAEGSPDSKSKAPASGPILRGVGLALLVEDQPPILKAMSRAFVGAGFRVLEARTAEEALASLKELDAPLNLLVSDVVLPGQSGVWLMEQARETRPGLPVLLTSGYMGDEGPRPGTNEATAFLPKPFTPRQLLAKALGLVTATSSEADGVD